MQDDEFKPRLGRMRGKSKGQGKAYLSLVVKAAKRANIGTRHRPFDGSRIGRGASVARVAGARDRLGAFRSRRAVIKISLVRLGAKASGGAKAHLRYIQRDGVTRDGQPGELYSAERNGAEGRAFLGRCEGDRHQFRFIVSAEDAAQYEDLKPFVRRLMDQAEDDLGTKLDWVAVDHFNTGHPHTHVLVRGKNDRGGDLVIAPEYIAHGLRERAIGLLNLDLGPRTDLEIEARLRDDMTAERLTAIDRRLIREMEGTHLIDARVGDTFQHSLRVGRLQKLARMNLATHLGGESWRLEPDLAVTLQRMGERADIIRTMQRELTASKLERAAADRVIYDPVAERTGPLVGRVVACGLADEFADRHYLLVDGIDGRVYFVGIGRSDALDVLPSHAIVEVTPRTGGVRPADRTIIEVGAANGGRYTVDAHLDHDPTASERFAETHVRRLEAMRRLTRSVERTVDGSWLITADHLAKVEQFEARQRRDRPVTVQILSSVPLDRLPTADAATWLDRELTSDAPLAMRNAGFGREVLAAKDLRQRWLLDQQFAAEGDAGLYYRPDMLAALHRRELVRVGRELSQELGRRYAEPGSGEPIHGRLVRAVELTSGRHALIARSRDFTLVPWRPVLDRAIGKTVSGIVRDGAISWTIHRKDRGLHIS